MRSPPPALVLLALSLSWLPAAEPAPGHSVHGEAFNEGPRQAASLMPGCGKVHLKITSNHAQAQAFFDQGLGQIHGFWYFEAERSFRQVATLDPQCAMAYWGMALANVNNERRARSFITKAGSLKAKCSAREKAWIEAWEIFYRQSSTDKRDKKQRNSDLITALEALVQDDRNDVEAKAFLVWKIWHAAGEIPIGSAQAVDALLDQIFALNPSHPAHHYRIHLWDSRKPALALKSAADNGPAAPAIAHMWHMPGHTYSKLKRFDDAVWQQEASTRVDHAYMIRNWILPDQIHNYAHNEEWLVRNFNELGRANDAIALATSLISNPQHPAHNTLEKEGSSSTYGRLRLLETLVQWELWPELLKLTQGPLLQAVAPPNQASKRSLAMGLAHFATGQTKALEGDLTALRQLREKTAKSQPIKPANATSPSSATQSTSPSKPSPASKPASPSRTDQGKADSAGPPPAQSQAAAPPGSAKTPAPAATSRSSTRPPSSSPSKAAPPSRPNRQLETIDKAIDALVACKAFIARQADAVSLIEKATELPKPMAGSMLLDLKAKAKAVALIEKAGTDLIGQISRAELYAKADEPAKARKALEAVAGLAFAMDRQLPASKRLDSLAAKLNFKQPWIQPPAKRNDLGHRPPLSSLGPMHWSPPKAPRWQALTLQGKTWSSEQLDGRAHLLLFYLGSSCTHCMEQINAFAKAQEKFTKQGIDLIAITREPLSTAGQLQEKMSTRKMPNFPVLCDPSLEAFKAFRAHDDFELEALHAAVLIDAKGRLRWWDISWEPFTQTEFLSQEAARLLSLP